MFRVDEACGLVNRTVTRDGPIESHIIPCGGGIVTCTVCCDIRTVAACTPFTTTAVAGIERTPIAAGRPTVTALAWPHCNSSVACSVRADGFAA